MSWKRFKKEIKRIGNDVKESISGGNPTNPEGNENKTLATQPQSTAPVKVGDEVPGSGKPGPQPAMVLTPELAEQIEADKVANAARLDTLKKKRLSEQKGERNLGRAATLLTQGKGKTESLLG